MRADGSAWVYAALFVAAFLVGVRSSIRLTGRYLRIAPSLRRADRMIPGLWVFIAWAITVAAGWFGAIAVWRLFGNAPVEWSPPISAGIATLILFLPLVIERVVDRIARAFAG